MKNLVFLILVVLAACASPVEPGPVVVVPVPRPTPPPIPVPVPVDPAPVQPDGAVVAFAAVQQIAIDMLRPALVALMGREPDGDRDMRDGTRMLRWPTTNADGKPKYVDVVVEVDAAAPSDRTLDKVLGKALVKR